MSAASWPRLAFARRRDTPRAGGQAGVAKRLGRDTPDRRKVSIGPLRKTRSPAGNHSWPGSTSTSIASKRSKSTHRSSLACKSLLDDHAAIGQPIPRDHARQQRERQTARWRTGISSSANSLPSVKKPKPALTPHSRPIRRPGAMAPSVGNTVITVTSRVSAGVTPAIGCFMVSMGTVRRSGGGGVETCRVTEPGGG